MYSALRHMVDMLWNQDPEHKSVFEPLIGSGWRALYYDHGSPWNRLITTATAPSILCLVITGITSKLGPIFRYYRVSLSSIALVTHVIQCPAIWIANDIVISSWDSNLGPKPLSPLVFVTFRLVLKQQKKRD